MIALQEKPNGKHISWEIQIYVVLTRKIQVTIYLSGTLAKTKIYLNWYFPPQKWDGG